MHLLFLFVLLTKFKRLEEKGGNHHSSGHKQATYPVHKACLSGEMVEDYFCKVELSALL